MPFTVRTRISVGEYLRKRAKHKKAGLRGLEREMGMAEDHLKVLTRPGSVAGRKSAERIATWMRSEGSPVPLRATIYLNRSIGDALLKDGL